MTNQFPLEEVRALLEKARTADAEYKQFGAKHHKYQLNPPASLEEVEAFEESVGVTLPEDYRNFLLYAGNGGAGPFYGLFCLEQVKGWLHWPLEPDKDPVLRPGENQNDGKPKDWKRGCLPIESEGDTYFACLLVTGPNRGRVVYIGYEGDWVFFPREPDFLSWYTRWLREVINGYRSAAWFATNLDGDEADLRRYYREADDKGERYLALISMKKFPVLSEESRNFICETLEDWITEPAAGGIPELAFRADPERYELFLEQRWNAGFYDDVLYELYYTPGDETAMAERWRERILEKLQAISPDYCNLVLMLLRRSGGIAFEQAAAFIERVPKEERQNLWITLGRLPDSKEHLEDFWLPLLEERENLKCLYSALVSVPRVNDNRLRDALLEVKKAFPYANEILHTDWHDPESAAQGHRRCREREIVNAADGILKKLFYDTINPEHANIPRPWRLELDGVALADLQIRQPKPPEGIPLHPLIALAILQTEDRLPSTAWDWDKKLKKLKRLVLVPTEAIVKNWDDLDRAAYLQGPEEHAPPAPYYYDLRDWSAIGRMTSLQELRICGVCVEDFSFLKQCKELKTLSLLNTNFTDCRLLLDLPKLKYVDLRECRLKNPEVLEGLPLEYDL